MCVFMNNKIVNQIDMVSDQYSSSTPDPKIGTILLFNHKITSLYYEIFIYCDGDPF